MGALDGRVALITGGARGQGRAHALALAAEGADIVVADAPAAMADLTYPLGTEDDLRETAKLVDQLGRRCMPLTVDVRDSAAVNAAVKQTVTDLGSLDIVVANAGIVSTGPLDEVSDGVWQQLVDTNLTGAFHTLRAAIPVMRQQKFGRIVVTSSMGGRMGIPELAAYNATKWGVIGLAKSVALEVAKEGITVNVVCPTTTQTPMVQPTGGGDIPDDLVRRMMKANPIPQPWLHPRTSAVACCTWSPTPASSPAASWKSASAAALASTDPNNAAYQAFTSDSSLFFSSGAGHGDGFGRCRTTCGHQNHLPISAAMDGVISDRTIRVSKSRPSPMVVPTWPITVS